MNIVNFIRGVEPRRATDLIEPVREQLALAKRYQLPFQTWPTGKPAVRELGQDELQITIPVLAGGEIVILCRVESLQFSVRGSAKP